VAFGVLLWAVPCALYAWGAARAAAGSAVRGAWIADAALHPLVGVLVAWDARRYVGTSWPLQTAIIGVGSYLTLSVAALVGAALAADDDPTAIAIALAALATACVANAAMLAILFEYFHRVALEQPRLARLSRVPSGPRPTSRTGGRV